MMFILRSIKMRHVYFAGACLAVVYVLYHLMHRRMEPYKPVVNHPSLLLQPEARPNHGHEFIFPVEQKVYPERKIDKEHYKGQVHESVRIQGLPMDELENPNVNPRKVASDIKLNDDESDPEFLQRQNEREAQRRHRVDALRILRQFSNLSFTGTQQLEENRLLPILRPLVKLITSSQKTGLPVMLHSPVSHRPKDNTAALPLELDRFWPEKDLPDLLHWREEMIQTAYRLPKDVGRRPFVGNGHLGMMAMDGSLRVRGLYTGRGRHSELASFPASILVEVSEATVSVLSAQPTQLQVNRMFQQSLAEAAFTQFLLLDEVAAGEKLEEDLEASEFQPNIHRFIVTQRVFAHWQTRHLLVHELEVLNLQPESATLTLKLNSLAPKVADDMTLMTVDRSSVGDTAVFEQVLHKHARLHSGESVEEDPLTAHVVHSPVPDEVSLAFEKVGQRRKLTFLLSVDVDVGTAWRQFIFGSQLVEHGDLLYASHLQACREQWAASRGTLFLRGDLQLSRAALWAQYSLLANAPVPVSWNHRAGGMSALGLMRSAHSSAKSGSPENVHHITAGQELWLQPWLVLMNPQSSLELLQYRMQTLSVAEDSARRLGYTKRQCLYPIASSHSGRELHQWSQSSSLASRIDDVNGYLAWALEHFLLAQNFTQSPERPLWDDRSIYHPDPAANGDSVTGRILLEKIARWFTTRLTPRKEKLSGTTNLTQEYDIDELLPKGQSGAQRNSLHLIGLAKLALEAPLVLERYLSGQSDIDTLPWNSTDIEAQLNDKPYWWNVRLADQIHIPLSVKKPSQSQRGDIAPQHEAYQWDERVSRVEVAYLAHPLDMTTKFALSEEKLALSLAHYETMLRDEGSTCMNSALLSIAWSRLKRTTESWDHLVAQLNHCFVRSTHGAFPVWHEAPVSRIDEPDTGSLPELLPSLYPAGAFLQTLLYGYWGVRLRATGLQVNPRLPSKTWWLQLRGLHYLGCVLDLDYGLPSRVRRNDLVAPEDDGGSRINSRMQLRVTLRRVAVGAQQIAVKPLAPLSQFREVVLRGVDQPAVFDYLSLETSMFLLRPTGKTWRTHEVSPKFLTLPWLHKQMDEMHSASMNLSEKLIPHIVDIERFEAELKKKELGPKVKQINKPQILPPNAEKPLPLKKTLEEIVAEEEDASRVGKNKQLKFQKGKSR